MKNIGILFGEFISWVDHPFHAMLHNDAYLQFAKLMEEYSLKIVVSTFGQCDNGTLRVGWANENGRWRLIKDFKMDLIYDKARADIQVNQDKVQRSGGVRLFNHPELNRICWDKKLTYETFPEFVPLTICPEDQGGFIGGYCDFFCGKAVLKPRFGIMGAGVRLVEGDSWGQMAGLDNYILQTYVDSTQGHVAMGLAGSHDLRLVLVNGEVAITYARVPAPGGIVSNHAQGGRMVEIDRNGIPESVFAVVAQVDRYMGRFGDRIYAIDLSIDKNGRPWIIELESSPSFSYPPEMEYKKLHFVKYIGTALKKLVES